MMMIGMMMMRMMRMMRMMMVIGNIRVLRSAAANIGANIQMCTHLNIHNGSVQSRGDDDDGNDDGGNDGDDDED